MLRKVLTSISLLLVFLLAGSIAMSCASRRAPALGVLRPADPADEAAIPRLTDCPGTPNCVNSQQEGDPHGIEPLRFEDEPREAFARLVALLEATPRVQVTERADDYLRTEFTTGLMRFVDDVEFLLLPEQKLIHVRSASRVGHSDLGANRKRVEALRARWSPAGEKTSSASKDGVLFRFDSEAACAPWQSIDDVVMGGRSKSGLTYSGEGTGVFSGTVSLENNGGFASVRFALMESDLRGASAIALRVRGDGKTYQLRLRDQDGFDGVNHCAEFRAPADQWKEVLVPLASLEPRYRGRVLRDEPPLGLGSIRSLGLMISEKQEGPFRLEIEWIRACGPEESTAV